VGRAPGARSWSSWGVGIDCMSDIYIYIYIYIYIERERERERERAQDKTYILIGTLLG
jgi:hypothetical protein